VFRGTVSGYKNTNEMLRSLGAEHCKTVEHGTGVHILYFIPTL
jgi:hypothetical protein